MKFARVNPLVLLASVVWRKPFKPVFSFFKSIRIKYNCTDGKKK